MFLNVEWQYLAPGVLVSLYLGFWVYYVLYYHRTEWKWSNRLVCACVPPEGVLEDKWRISTHAFQHLVLLMHVVSGNSTALPTLHSVRQTFSLQLTLWTRASRTSLQLQVNLIDFTWKPSSSIGRLTLKREKQSFEMLKTAQQFP